jgi:hypothetical protein
VIFNPERASQSPAASRVEAAHRTARLIVLVFAASIAAYVIIGIFIARASASAGTWFPLPFYVAAVFLALGSLALHRTQFRPLRLEAVAGLRGTEGLVKHFVKITVISAALAEACGLLGLISGLTGGDQWDVIRLGVVGLVVVLYNYPKRSSWQRAVNYFAEKIGQ